MNSPKQSTSKYNNLQTQFSLLDENVDLIKNTNPHPTTSTPYVCTPNNKNKKTATGKRNSKKSSSPRDATRQISMAKSLVDTIDYQETPRACSTPKSKGNVREKIKMFNEMGQSSSALSRQLLPIHSIDSIDISKISSIHPNFTDEENYSRNTTCSCSNSSKPSSSTSNSTISFTDVNTDSSYYLRTNNFLDQKFSHIDSQDPNLLSDPELDEIFEKSDANIKILTPLLLKKLSQETAEYRQKTIDLRKNEPQTLDHMSMMVDITPKVNKNSRKRAILDTRPDDHMVTPEIKIKRNKSERLSIDEQKQAKKKTSLGPNGEII